MTFFSDQKTGVYFDMPEAEYRSDPALSTSELKYMAVSPLEFHAYRTKQIAFERSESMRLGTNRGRGGVASCGLSGLRAAPGARNIGGMCVSSG